jgi:hypothetical protein
MSEVEKKIESNLNNLENQEIALPKEEQKEKISSPEKVAEKNVPSEKNTEDQTQNNVQVSKNQQKVPHTPVNDRLREAIDDILEEGLEDIYLNMSKEKQVEFRAKGEEATKEIISLLGQTKVKVKKIVQVIIEWLKVISGVNKFFIKQTAKIKTDKILEAQKKK